MATPRRKIASSPTDVAGYEGCKCSDISTKSNLKGRLPGITGEQFVCNFDREGTSRNVDKCVLCRLAHTILQRDDLQTVSLFRHLAGKYRTALDREEDVIGLKFGSLEQFNTRHGQVRLIPLANDLAVDRRAVSNHARPLKPDCADRELMKDWLQRCEHDHVECKAYETKVGGIRMPRRLINVTRWCIEEALPSNTRYFALSYVWGNITRLQLPSEEIDVLCRPGFLQEDIDLKLHRVVQDAIQLTRDLGEEYLWVDSLCIRQDRDDEKAVEIANMNHVYKGAVLTIVAIDTPNANESLHGVRPYTRPRDNVIHVVNGTRLLLTQPSLSVILQDSLCRWSQRAWTLQERLLSRRKLFMTANQAYFTCKSTTYMEDRYEGQGDWYQLKQLDREDLRFEKEFPFVPYPKATMLQQRPDNQWWAVWKQITASYSVRCSAQDADRYHAFQGVLSEQREVWGTHCIAGLPLCILPIALCWGHGSDPLIFATKTVERIECYPSWSWIGWHGEVSFPRWKGGMRSTVKSIAVYRGSTLVSSYCYTWNRANSEIRGTQSHLSNPLEAQIAVQIEQSNIRDNIDAAPYGISAVERDSKVTLVFESLLVIVLATLSRPDLGRWKIVEGKHQRWVGSLSTPCPVQTHSLREPTRPSEVVFKCILIGTSRRKYCFLTRGGYRMAEDVHDQTLFQKLLPFVLAIALVLLLIGAIVFVTIVTFITPSVWFIFIGVAVILAILSLGPLYYLFKIDTLAHLIVVKDEGNNVYERCGTAEMSLRAFKKANPQICTSKLI